MDIFLLATGLIGIAFLGLGISIFFRRGGKFPETEIGKNKHMRELGITCTKCDERQKWKEARRKEKVFILPKNLGVDLSQLR